MRTLKNLVVVEGAHGTGKTTIAKSLVKNLRKNGYNSTYTKEPHVHALHQLMTQLSTKQTRGAMALACLVATDRFLHLRKVRDWLSSGLTVVTDRYVTSSFVYQVIDGLSPRLIQEMNSFVPEPELRIYVRAPYRLRIQRLKRTIRARPHDIFLTEKALLREQRLYDIVITRDMRSSRCLVLDGAQPSENCAKSALNFVLSWLRR